MEIQVQGNPLLMLRNREVLQVRSNSTNYTEYEYRVQAQYNYSLLSALSALPAGGLRCLSTNCARSGRPSISMPLNSSSA